MKLTKRKRLDGKEKEARDKEIIQDRMQGMTVAELSYKYRITTTQIYNILHDAEVLLIFDKKRGGELYDSKNKI
jgi:Mor family transcriptional regulator